MGPLRGIRVLDFGRYVAGPYCATLLADFGADVIRVERSSGGEDRWIAPVTEGGEGALFLQVNRNKRSLTLDPRSANGREIMRRLVATADVVVVNVPDDALKPMGLDYDTLRSVRSDIVLANVSSFGPTGPWADRPGFDSVGQAMCGSAHLSGFGEVPVRTPITWVDHASALYAAFGVMVALLERLRTGRGQQISASLFGSAIGFASTYLIEQAMTQLDRVAIGNRSYLNGPTDTFRTLDGWIVTQVVGASIFRRWAALMGEPCWSTDPRFSTDELRGKNGALLSERMQSWCAQRDSAQALDELARANIPAGPVLSPREVLAHPQVAAMGLLVPMKTADHPAVIPLVATPINLSETPAAIDRPAPRVGEHTRELLLELGFTDTEIDAMRATAPVARSTTEEIK
jgi:crotonobetainyl-CoA:carnitine CoA-transferase CaiB-like acyl-CoA transferase